MPHQPEFCFCIHNALAGVPPLKRRPGSQARVCDLCAPYACNSIHHPERLTKQLAERLKDRPYFATSRVAQRMARFAARRAAIKRLQEGWKAEAEGRIGHCARCRRWLPLVRNGRCEYCERV